MGQEKIQAQRELKFRAWDGVSAQMIEQYLYLNGSGRFIGHTHESDSCIVMQYTGLKDKNGREIYEGDIVRPSLNHIGMNCEVIFGKLGLSLKTQFWENYFPIHVWIELEIIGNIYANPDLLTPSH